MFSKDAINKSYEELLEECKLAREREVQEFIEDLEEEIKKAMSKGHSEVYKNGKQVHCEEKDTIVHYFSKLGFDVDFRTEVIEKLIPCKFTISWKHLLK